MSTQSKIEWTEATLTIPLRRRKPSVWVNKNDLFNDDVPFNFIDKVFAVMALCPQHTFQILTKRPKRMAEYMNSDGIGYRISRRIERFASTKFAGFDPDRSTLVFGKEGASMCVTGGERKPMRAWPLPNVWLGTSCENQEAVDERIPHLLKCPAAVRFLSCEPLIGAIDVSPYLFFDENVKKCMKCGFFTNRPADITCPNDGETLGRDTRVDWVIVGGESGPKARPMHPDWARSIRDQCVAAGVPFFFKQWGEWFPRDQWEGNPYLVLPDDCDSYSDSRDVIVLKDALGQPVPMHRVGKKAAGRLLDGLAWNEMPTGLRVRQTPKGVTP